jgi:hypothetical protein
MNDPTESSKTTNKIDGAADATAHADVGHRRSSEPATVAISTPEGTMYLESGDPKKVEIGIINLPNDAKVDIKTDGVFEVGTVNVGTEQVEKQQYERSDAYYFGVPVVGLIAALVIVFSVICLLGWKALSIRTTN